MNNQTNPKTLVTAILCVILSAPLVSNAAVGKNNTQIDTLKLTISDLNLSHEKGVATLYQRLKNNVGKVCGVRDTYVTGSRIASSKIKRQHKKCSRLALNNAVESINNEQLTELHKSSSS